MATALLPQLQPQSSGLASPISETTPTDAPTGLLSRTWNPPPRPKPGRKPATDTPPSKRKAQNRLAQRNFRERRAAKVNELEDQMKDLQDQHDAEVDELQSSAHQLKNHIALLESTLQADRSTIQSLQHELERERTLRHAAEIKLARAEEELNKAGVVPLARRRNPGSDTIPDRLLPQIDLPNPDNMQGNDTGKRPPSPHDSSNSKRPRIDNLLSADSPTEVDLTTRPKIASRAANSDPSTTFATSDLDVDNCGFCDTNPDSCVCRSKEDEPSDQLEIDVTDIAVPVSTRPVGCAGRPGSCKQCQEDPASANFCKSFARTHSGNLKLKDPEKSGGAGCGLTNCCRVQHPTSHMRTGSLSEQLQGLSTNGTSGNSGESTLDCAAAYRKLRVHPKFDEAMAHVDDWTPQLAMPSSKPKPPRQESLEGRTPYEIEAASVMSTLKYFDNQFGSDARSDWRHQN